MKKMFSSKFLFAGKTVLVKTNNKKMNQRITCCFPEFESKNKPDLTLEYYFYEENSEANANILKNPVKVEEAIKTVMHKNKNLIKFELKKRKKKLVSGFLDLKKKQGKMEIRTNKSFFLRFFVFNMAKCIAIYLNDFKGNIIHSSAMAKNGKGFLFSGKDEGGKTTVLRLCPEGIELGDDLNFLFKKGKKFFIQSFPLVLDPININKHSAKHFELKAIFMINKSKKLKLKKATKIQSMIKLIENDIQGTCKFQNIKTKQRLSLYEELLSSVPVFFLHFPIQQNLWKKIEAKLKKEIALK
ncbi:MAG: hypothetical protein ABH986_04170 [archaeon]